MLGTCLLLGLTISACGDDSTRGRAAPSSPTVAAGTVASSMAAPTGASVAPSAGTSAPQGSSTPGSAAQRFASLDWKAPLVGGGELDAATLSGKPVVLWFWAPG